MKTQNLSATFTSKLKKHIGEMYADSVISCVLGKAPDAITTYLNIKKYSIEAEIDPITKTILTLFSPEASGIMFYGISLLAILSFYIVSKGMEKAISLITSDSLLKWKDFYNSLLYGFTISSIAASINNTLLFFEYPTPNKELLIVLPYIVLGGSLGLKLWKRRK